MNAQRIQCNGTSASTGGWWKQGEVSKAWKGALGDGTLNYWADFVLDLCIAQKIKKIKKMNFQTSPSKSGPYANVW